LKIVSIESGLSWDDRESIQIENRSPVATRKGGVPLWLFKMENIRLVLCEVVWQFIFYGHAGECPPLLKNNLAELTRAADVQWARYAATHVGRTKEGKALARAVKRCGGIVPLLAKLLWGYRMGWDSCAIAAETGLTPAAVRQRLSRMQIIARRLGLDIPHAA
jgi:hypothetical protein